MSADSASLNADDATQESIPVRISKVLDSMFLSPRKLFQGSLLHICILLKFACRAWKINSDVKKNHQNRHCQPVSIHTAVPRA